VLEYLQRYAEQNDLEVRTGVEVKRIDRGGAGWSVVTADDVLEAERVVVATGHSSVPFIPDWAGAFAGEIVHSADYRNPAPYVGRRVLVVGSGNSGTEIAVDLADGGAAEVSLAVRTPPSIIRRDTLGFPSQVLGIATGRLPVPVVDRIAAVIRRVSIPDLTPYGLVAPARPYSDFLRRRVIPILDVGLVDAVRTGRVRVVPALERFEDGRAVLAGDRVPDRFGAVGRPPRRPRRPRRAARPRGGRASSRTRSSLRRVPGDARRNVPPGRDPGEATGPTSRGGSGAEAAAAAIAA
jgi:putative flavoprotein involved in K+ transport